MNKVAVIFLLPLLLLVTGANPAQADSSYWDWLLSVKHMKEIAPVTNETYNEECSSCHMPYQPGLLPAASWKKLLTSSALEDHFGENAELDPDTLALILNYAVKNSASTSLYKRSKKIMSSLDDNKTYLRITDIPYIKNKHHEVTELIGKNKKVNSLSFCDNCHTKADQGIYDHDTVFIPGYGYW